MKYTYNIKDGQFSRELLQNKLLGNSGDVIQLDDDGEIVEAYILYIEGDFVQCLGNIEREFPTKLQEHNRMFNIMKIEEEQEFSIAGMNSDREIIDSPIVVTANSKEEAIKIFQSDYLELEIYQIE